MAPEVILAMDEGQYDGKADIWSMGITCIELAERKPPLFNMNAMSALYHIAQNDSPTLSEMIPDGDKTVQTNWSMNFKRFVALLLQKVPDERPTSEEVLQQQFLVKERSPTCVSDLIERTKNVVRDLDNLQYRKMKKILMAENKGKESLQSQSVGSAELVVQKMDTTDDDMDGGSRTDSLASNPSFASVASSSKSSSISSLNESRFSDSGSINSQDGASSGISEEAISSVPAASTLQLQQAHTYSPSNSPVVTQRQESSHIQAATVLGPSLSTRMKDKISQSQKAQRERFATIRSAQVVHRQMYEHNEDNRHREQMLGYKRMRQQHQKQLINFEQKLKNEMDEYSVKLVKELENTRATFAQELERLVKKHQQELEKEAKQQQGDDRKYQKHIEQMQEQEIKGFLQQQKKEYKDKKEQLKEDSSHMQGGKEVRDEWLSRQISVIVSMHSQAENQLRERYGQTLELEVRKYRRKALLSRHNLEQDLLREELNLKQQHKDKEHDLLLRQHDATQALEYKHLHAIHAQRIDHLKSQHQTELSNQMEYSQRRESELRRKHLAAIRQQPKSLKVSETQNKFSRKVPPTPIKRRTWLSKLRRHANSSLAACNSQIRPSMGVNPLPCLKQLSDLCSNSHCSLCHIISFLDMVCLLDDVPLFRLYNILSNLIELTALHIMMHKSVCAEDIVKNDVHIKIPHYSEAINVTEEDLIELAAKTQGGEELAKLKMGLNTIRDENQEQVVLKLHSRLLFTKSDEVSVDESNVGLTTVDVMPDDSSDDGNGEGNGHAHGSYKQPLSSSSIDEESVDNLDILPPELCRTYPVLRKPHDDEMDEVDQPRNQSAVKKEVLVRPNNLNKPRKSQSFPNVSRNKLAKNLARPSKATKLRPWIPSGTGQEHSASVYGSSSGLRQKIVAKSSDFFKSGESCSNPRTPRQEHKSMNILEKTRVYAGSSNIATVYRKVTSPKSAPAPCSNNPPWRHHSSGSIKPVPTIKPFVLRKATRRHELGLNRYELQNLKSGLHMVFDLDSSCYGNEDKSSDLTLPPMGHTSYRMTSSRLLDPTFSSSKKSQKEYLGCKGCRLKKTLHISSHPDCSQSKPHNYSEQAKLLVEDDSITNTNRDQNLLKEESYIATSKDSIENMNKKKDSLGLKTVFSFFNRRPLKQSFVVLLLATFAFGFIHFLLNHPYGLVPYLGFCSTISLEVAKSSGYRSVVRGKVDEEACDSVIEFFEFWMLLSLKERALLPLNFIAQLLSKAFSVLKSDFQMVARYRLHSKISSLVTGISVIVIYQFYPGNFLFTLLLISSVVLFFVLRVAD